jgi:hypothetical protein
MRAATNGADLSGACTIAARNGATSSRANAPVAGVLSPHPNDMGTGSSPVFDCRTLQDPASLPESMQHACHVSGHACAGAQRLSIDSRRGPAEADLSLSLSAYLRVN